MEVIKEKASEDCIRIWEANARLENLFGIQQRQVRVREALAESVMYEPQSPGIKEVEKIFGGADPWDLGRRWERRLPARGERHGDGGMERDPLPRDAEAMCYPPLALPRATAHGAGDENARDRGDASGFAETRMKMNSGFIYGSQRCTLHGTVPNAQGFISRNVPTHSLIVSILFSLLAWFSLHGNYWNFARGDA